MCLANFRILRAEKAIVASQRMAGVMRLTRSPSKTAFSFANSALTFLLKYAHLMTFCAAEIPVVAAVVEGEVITGS